MSFWTAILAHFSSRQVKGKPSPPKKVVEYERPCQKAYDTVDVFSKKFGSC